MHKIRNLGIFIIITWMCGVELKAQQMPLYSDYVMNGFVINPAVAGSDGFTTIGLAARDHMVGFDNSPKTSVLSFQTRLLKRNYQIRNNPLFNNRTLSKRSGRVGVGAQVFSDNNGYMERTGGQISYAYHINTEKSQLSFGLALTTFQFHIDLDKLKFRDNETIIDQGFENKVLVPDVSFGTYYLTTTSFFGFSIDNLFQSRIKIGTETYDYRLYRHYYLMGGKRFNPENEFALEPSFLLKGTEKMVFQGDMQVRAYYQQDYYMGLSYRTGSAVGVLLGVKFGRIHFCYAYDYMLNSIQKYTYGSHEINIALKLGDSARRYRWLIRY